MFRTRALNGLRARIQNTNQAQPCTAFPKRTPAPAWRELASSPGSGGKGMRVKGGPNRMCDCAAAHCAVRCVLMIRNSAVTSPVPPRREATEKGTKKERTREREKR